MSKVVILWKKSNWNSKVSNETKRGLEKSVDTNLSSPTKIVVISRAQGNKIGMGLSNQTTFCGEKKPLLQPANL